MLPLESVIRESYGRVAWTHKTHEKQADIYETKISRLKWLKIIISGLATTGGVTSLFAECFGVQVMVAMTTTSLLIINSFLSDICSKDRLFAHIQVASKLWNYREKYLLLLSEINTDNPNLDTINERCLSYVDELSVIYKDAPRTTSEAYNMATKALHESELYFTPEEINRILPKKLRK